MNKIFSLANVKVALALGVLSALTGCVGYVDGGGGGAVVVDTPYVEGPYFYGGIGGPGRDVHAFRDRGFSSRGIAHPGGGGFHGGGGHGGGGGGRR